MSGATSVRRGCWSMTAGTMAGATTIFAAAPAHRGDPRRHAHDHRAQQVAGHFLRPLDQSLSRLRAWLHLLLRAADPRLSRHVAGDRFRVPPVRQAERGRAAGQGIVGARLCAAHHRHRHQHRSLSADREEDAHHALDPRSAARIPPSRRHRHEIAAGAARHRHPGRDGGDGAGEGRAVGDDARPQARAHDGAARRNAAAPAAGDQGN